MDADGNLLVAYQADLPKDNPDVDAVHVRTLKDGKWSEPTLIGKASGLMLGGIRTASFNGQVFLAWVHRANYTSGAMQVSGPVRSFVILDKKGWSSPKPAASITDPFTGGGFMGDHFIGLHVDQLGRVHMAWSSGPHNYHAIATELQPPAPSTRDKGGK